MADGQFSPDLLLTVGADLTALRQQLATIQREIGATPVNVGIQPQQTQQIAQVRQQVQQVTQALNDESTAVRRVGGAVDESSQAYRRLIQLQIQAGEEDRRRILQQITAEKEYQATLQQRGRVQGVASAEDDARTRQRILQQIAAEKEYQAILQQRGRVQGAASAEDEARTRRLGVLQIQAERAYQAEIQRTRLADEAVTVERLRNIRRIEAELARLQTLQTRAVGVGAALPSGTAGQLGALQAGLGTLQGGGRLSPTEIASLSNETARLDRAIRGTTEAARAGGIGLEGMFGQFGRYIRVAGFLTVVYGGMRAVFAGVQEYIAVDKQLRTIAATMEDSAERSRVMRDSWKLLVEANQQLGTSFSESGEVLITLQKILGNNTEEIQGAFIPSLALASIAEGNQVEILRVLVGSYQLFGRSLGDAVPPAEKFERIANAIANASVASIQDISGFTTALQTVIPAATGAGVSLEDTLTLLTLLQNGMQSASRAGTGLARLMIDMQRFAPQISRIFDIPFDVDKPVPVVELMTQMAQKLREAGPLTTELAGKIREAIPDERAQRALQTFVEQLDKFLDVQKRVAEGGDRISQLIREQSLRIEASIGRLRGAIFREFSEALNTITGSEFGDQSGIVNFIDGITRAVSLGGSVLKDYLETVRSIGGAFIGMYDLILRAFGTDTIAVFKRGLEEAAITARQFLLVIRTIPEIVRPSGDQTRKQVFDKFLEDLTRVENDVRSAVQGYRQKAEQEVIDLSAGPRPAPSPPQPVQLTDSFKASLIAEANDLQKRIQAEFYRNRTDLPIELRITNAQHVVAEAEKIAREARGRFERGDFPTAGERESGAKEVESTVRKVEQARAVLRKLNEEGLEQAFKIAQLDEKNIEQLNKEFQLRLEIDARRRTATGDYSRSHEREMKLQADLNKTQDEGVRLELYELSVLEAQEELRQKSLSGVEQQTEALRRQLALVAIIAREAGLSPQAAQTAEIDRSFGIDKLTASTRELAATMNLVGVEAAKATVAARQGFESFEAMLIIAERAKARIGPPTAREQDAITGVEGANRRAEATRADQIEQAKKQVVDLAREERILQATFGQTTEEAIKQTLAIRNTSKTWEELAGSLEQADRDYAAVIAKIAEATAEGRIQAEVLGLQAAGFDELTARMIATQNEADRLKFDELRRAGESIEEFNTRLERMRDAIGKNAQEMARFNQDPFSFLAISLKRASDQANEFWASLKTLAEDTAKSMPQSLSDFFFNSFQGKLDAGKEAWKSFLGSMERALADFMSKQLVRSFLNILTGGGSEASTGVAGVGGAGIAGALGGVASGFGSIGANYSAGGGGFAGIGAALFGLPMTPTTVRAGLQPSNPEIDDPTSLSQIQAVRQATSGIIGTGGNVSRDLAVAGVIAAAYTTSQSVLKLTNEISTEQDRNAGTGGIAGTIIGGLAGAFFGSSGAALGAGAGGLAGSFLGGLFGSDQAPAGRFDELARTIGTVQTSLEAAVTGAKTFTDLYNVLLGFQGGGALAAATQQPVQISAGGQGISGLSQEAFLTALRANPSSLIASVQAGVSPELLGPINQEVVQTILAKVAALDDVNRQISLVIAEISAQTIAPATGINSFDTLKEQAISFRATVDQLIAANEAQVLSLEDLLRVTTDPGQILQYTTQIKDLIEDRYQTEAQLVQQFAGQLDSLATSLTNVGKSIEEQIFNLQLSNFGPTNPLQGFQLAQGRFNTARAAFEADPTAENAQAVQQAVDPLLKAASEVFTRPSPEYRAIFAEIVDALETVKISVDSQAADIQGALQAALGTSITIQDLTQRNTAAMAADMRQLLAIVQVQAAAAGVGLGAGAGFLNPANNPPPGGQVAAPTAPPQESSGSETGALLAAVGTIGALAGPLLTIADRLGATDYLKNLISGLFTSPTIGEDPFPAGTTVPQFMLPQIPDFSFPDFLSGAPFSPYSFYDYGSFYPSFTPFDYGYLAEGGPVPGSGMGDTVRAMLEPGEFVVRRDAAARNREWLEQINGPGSGVSRRGILHFQTGGTVPTSTSPPGATPEDIAILLYLQSVLGGSSAEAQALLAELIRQAQASPGPTAAPATPSTVSGSPGSTPSAVSGTQATAPPSLVETDPTLDMLRLIQQALGTGRTVASLFGGSAGLAPTTTAAISSGLQLATGGLGLFTSIESEDPFGAATSSVSLISGVYNLLASQGLVPTTGVLFANLASSLGVQLSAAGGAAAAGGVAAAIVAAIQIAQIATDGSLSDEEKAIQATKAATTAVAVALAGPTFGASLAVLQIWDFIERVRAGQEPGEALVFANDPTTLLAGIVGERGLAANIFGPSESWLDFAGKLQGTLTGEGRALSQLITILPFVDSQQQLAAVIAQFKQQVFQAGVGGFGEGTGAFGIPGLPGATGTEHEGGLSVNFDQVTSDLQTVINALIPVLPATGGRDALGLSSNLTLQDLATAEAAVSGVGPSAPAQFLVRFPDGTFGVVTGAEMAARNEYIARTGDAAYAVAENVFYGDPRYNYAKAGIPDPNWTAGPVSASWQQLLGLPAEIAAALPPPSPAPLPVTAPTYHDLFVPPPMPALPTIEEIYADLAISGTGDLYGTALRLALSRGVSEFEALTYASGIAGRFANESPGGFQAGGFVPGVSQGRDSVVAMLEPGEFIVPRAIAQEHSDLLKSLIGDGGGPSDGFLRSDTGNRVSTARELVGGVWDGLHHPDMGMGSMISAAARSGDHRREGGVSSVALHIAEGAIRIDGARDPKVVSKDVLEAIEQNIRTGRLGQVIASRVRPQRTGV